MNAQRKVNFLPVAADSSGTSLLDGDGTSMFSSGSGPATHGAMLDGDLVEMFSSGSAPFQGRATVLGAQTGLFSSGS